jgi:hypothetical protein
MLAGGMMTGPNKALESLLALCGNIARSSIQLRWPE